MGETEDIQDRNDNGEQYYSREDFDIKQQPEETPVQPMPEAKKLHIPVWVLLFLAGVLALDIICMVRFPKTFKEYKTYKTAERRVKQGETSEVLAELYQLSEKHPENMTLLVENVELAMENGYYDMAEYLIDTHIAGVELDEDDYNKVNDYCGTLENYYNSYDAIEKIYGAYSNSQSLSEENLKDMQMKIRALLEQEDQDYAYIYYNLGILEADTVTAKEYLQKCYDINPECYDVRVQLGVMYRRLGDYDSALRYTKEALAKDKKDSGALRAMAILCMLNKDDVKGLDYAEDAYQSYPDGNYVRETYLIALTLNRRKEAADKIRMELISAGIILDEDTVKLLKGDITLEDYYVQKEEEQK